MTNSSTNQNLPDEVLEIMQFRQNILIPFSQRLLELLCFTFFTVAHELIIDRDGRYRLSPRFHPLIFLGKDELGRRYIEAHAGLAPLIQECLDRNGYEQRWSGIPAEFPNPIWDRLTPFGAIDCELIRKVGQGDRGLFHYFKSRVSLAKCIAQIAKAYPDKRIVVCVALVDEVRRLTSELRKYGLDVSMQHGRSHNPMRTRVVVSTYRQLETEEVEIHNRDIAFVHNASDFVRSKNGMLILRWMAKARLYGFQSDEERLSPYDRDRVLSVFGQLKIRIPEHGRVQREVAVFMAPFKGGNRIPRDSDTFEIRRQGIWKHTPRNRRIAKVAKALLSGDASKMEGTLADINQSPEQTDRIGRIAVLAANVEHALSLQRLLPDFSVVTAKQPDVEDLSDNQHLSILSGNSPHLRTTNNVIATCGGLKRAGRYDVLIRADGGVGLPVFANKVATVEASEYPRRLRIIDFTDRHHPQLRKESRYRKEAYVKTGWNLAEIQPESPFDQFLATRPKVEY